MPYFLLKSPSKSSSGLRIVIFHILHPIVDYFVYFIACREGFVQGFSNLIHSSLDVSLARSLKYIDLRLIDRGFVYRSSLELEFSAIACYIGSGIGSRGMEGSEPSGQAESKDDSNANGGKTCRTSHYSSAYPLPVILVSRSVFKAFQTDFYGYPKHLLLPTTPQTRWVGLGRPPVVTSNPRHQSLYYREWTEPKPKQVPGQQQQDASSKPVITLRSASGVIISPDISGKVVIACVSDTELSDVQGGISRT